MVLEIKRQDDELVRTAMFFIDGVPRFHCTCGHVVGDGGFVLVHDKLVVDYRREYKDVMFEAQRPADIVCKECARFWRKNLGAYVGHIKTLKERAESVEKGGDESVPVVSTGKGDQP